jgi:hypothetical protein
MLVAQVQSIGLEKAAANRIRKGADGRMTVTEKVKGEKAKQLSVSIAYNGLNGSFDYNEKQETGALRARALNHYGIRGQGREENFLFGPDNQTELADDRPIGEQVTPGSQLYLRPRAAGGGSK